MSLDIPVCGAYHFYTPLSFMLTLFSPSEKKLLEAG